MKIGKKKIVTMVLSLAMILGIIAFPSQTISADAEKSALAEEVDNTDALHLNKTAKWDEKEENVDITLEAFTTGELSTVEKSVPLDITLVLDQSGSMDEPFDYDYQVSYERYTGHYLDSSNRPLYYLDSGQYYPVNVEVSRLSRVGERRFTYTYQKDGQTIEIAQKDCLLWGWGWKWPFVDEGVNWINSSWNLYYQQTSSIEIKKIDSLKNSVNNFVEQVRKNASDNNVNHRISIVGFASMFGYGNNTEVLTVEGENSVWEQPSGTEGEPKMIGVSYDNANDQTYHDAMVDSGNDLVDCAIKALATNGATRADLGMEMANNVLIQNKPNEDENRKQIVIMFTDGEPNDGNGFDDEVAKSAIINAKDIKTKGAEVYTIGIFKGAEANNTDKKNTYMNMVSSNYDKNGIDTGKREYYYSAKNSDALNDVFDKIFEDISKPGIDLDSETIVQDQLSNYFNMSSLDEDDVEVYTQKCTEINGDKYVFSDEKEYLANPDITIENNKVQVSGFDFNANFCAKNKENPNDVKGKKLVVKFKVKPIDGFIGGNAVPTNNYTNSGIYDKTGKEVKCFNTEENQPKVDVDINYHYEAKDAAMYLTENWENLTSLISKDAYWTTDKSKQHNISEQFVNDYVDIKYIFTLDNKVVGRYEIANGADKGDWEYISDYSTMDIRSNVEKFNIELNVVPSISSGIPNDGNKELAPEVDENKNVKLYIYKPIIKSHDKDYVFLGDTFTEELLNSLVNNVDWKCFDSSKPENIKPGTSEPSLSYKYQYNGKNSIDYKPSKSGIYKVEYTVETNGIDITKYAKKEHDGDLSVDINPCNQNHFFIKVIGGTINIDKVIDKDSLDKYDFTNGDPIFGFKIDKLNNDDKVEKTYYRYVRFYKENGDIKHDNITPLTDLP
ncbi:VWA domain-containing protein [Amedibacterium intestinale]|uniref:VWA domain-containing protein n=1 Tax=Amedibacterium intestinale TaxID=2583452 RepID=UPI000E205BD9